MVIDVIAPKTEGSMGSHGRYLEDHPMTDASG